MQDLFLPMDERLAPLLHANAKRIGTHLSNFSLEVDHGLPLILHKWT